jgi:hypothetical protein
VPTAHVDDRSVTELLNVGPCLNKVLFSRQWLSTSSSVVVNATGWLPVLVLRRRVGAHLPIRLVLGTPNTELHRPTRGNSNGS